MSRILGCPQPALHHPDKLRSSLTASDPPAGSHIFRSHSSLSLCDIPVLILPDRSYCHLRFCLPLFQSIPVFLRLFVQKQIHINCYLPVLYRKYTPKSPISPILYKFFIAICNTITVLLHINEYP